jgi:hypothetical protein
MQPLAEAAGIHRPTSALSRSLSAAAWVLVLMLPGHAARAQSACEASEHGMRADGSDNAAAFTRTLAECAGRSIHIARGTYVFSPQGFAHGFQLPAGTAIVGDGSRGPQATVLQVAGGGNFAALLWIRNVSGVSVRGIRFEGTAYESGCSRRLDYGHAIYIQSDPGAPAGVDGVAIADNQFHNFNGQSWITINAADGSPGIGLNVPITVANNVLDSDAKLAGSCADGPMTALAAMISIHGSNTSAQGMAENVSVTSNTLNAGYVKEGITVWSGTRNITIRSNLVAATGLRVPRRQGPELGRYAILVYHSAHELPGLEPEAVLIADNTITDPVSCGIYAAGGRNLQISGNRISGQTDGYDVTLPKGAIALNHAKNVSVSGNELANNHIGISSVGSELRLGTNKIAVPAGGIGTKIR